MTRHGRGTAWGNWLVSKTSGFLDARFSRRSFIARTTLLGSAVAATGHVVLTRPGSPYSRITDCPPGSLCTDGYTEFCCVINKGMNACPENTIPAGWWRADYSVFCNGQRYYIDCNEICSGPGVGGGFCAGSSPCGCADGCNTRRVHCNYFRYGQCNTGIAFVGPIACRMVTCIPPFLLDIGCDFSGAVDNATADHNADCARYEPEEDDMKGILVQAPGEPAVMVLNVGTGTLAWMQDPNALSVVSFLWSLGLVDSSIHTVAKADLQGMAWIGPKPPGW